MLPVVAAGAILVAALAVLSRTGATTITAGQRTPNIPEAADTFMRAVVILTAGECGDPALGPGSVASPLLREFAARQTTAADRLIPVPPVALPLPESGCLPKVRPSPDEQAVLKAFAAITEQIANSPAIASAEKVAFGCTTQRLPNLALAGTYRDTVERYQLRLADRRAVRADTETGVAEAEFRRFDAAYQSCFRQEGAPVYRREMLGHLSGVSPESLAAASRVLASRRPTSPEWREFEDSYVCRVLTDPSTCRTS